MSAAPASVFQGFHPLKWKDFTTTLDGPEVAIFKEACKRNKVTPAALVRDLIQANSILGHEVGVDEQRCTCQASLS